MLTHFSAVYSLFFLYRNLWLQVAAQAGGQQLKDSLFRFLIIRKRPFHHIFGIHHRRCENMQPQQILIDLSQRGKNLHEKPDHSNKRMEIGGIPALVIFREESTVPEAVIKNGFIRMGHPKPEVGQPQFFY